MGDNLCSVEDWLARNHNGIVHCPYQPGRLVISEKACLKRHMAAQKQERRAEWMKGGDNFYYRLTRGLTLCQECSVGKQLAGFDSPDAVACEMTQ